MICHGNGVVGLRNTHKLSQHCCTNAIIVEYVFKMQLEKYVKNI